MTARPGELAVAGQQRGAHDRSGDEPELGKVSEDMGAAMKAAPIGAATAVSDLIGAPPLLQPQ